MDTVRARFQRRLRSGGLTPALAQLAQRMPAAGELRV